MQRHSLGAVDLATLAYNGIVVALIVTFRQRIDAYVLEALTNIGVIGLIVCIIYVSERRPTPFVRIVRDFYPILLFPVFYRQVGNISHIIFEESFDSVLSQLEEMLFGFQPALHFARSFPQWWWAEYMHFAYATYYLLLPGLGWLLYKRHDHFRDYLFTLCSTMYVCYLLFLLVPAHGPGVYDADGFPGGFVFIPLMNAIIQLDNDQGGAMPSSHVAAAVVVLYYAWRYLPKTVVVIAPICLSLMLATVYCGYHYAIDVLGGVLTAALTIGLSRWACRRGTTARDRLSPARTVSSQPRAP